jgi:hypothetical protein
MAGHDWQAERLRYLVRFSDGGSGMRYRDVQLDVGDELTEGAQRYTVERVEQAGNPSRVGACVGKADRPGFDSPRLSRESAQRAQARPLCTR